MCTDEDVAWADMETARSALRRTHGADTHLDVQAPTPFALARQPARIRFAVQGGQREAQEERFSPLGTSRPEARAHRTAEDSVCLWDIVVRSSLDRRAIGNGSDPGLPSTCLEARRDPSAISRRART